MIDIIEQKKLREYILGIDEEHESRTHPEEDYTRWSRLQEFYRQLSSDSPHREIIESGILLLINEDDPLSIGAGVTLARLLDLQSVEESLKKIIHQGHYPELPAHTQELILHAIAHLRVDSLFEFLFKELLNRGLLLSYLITWSSRPAHVGQVDADDLWRMDCLAKFYEDEAKAGARGDVEAQLASEHLHRAKLVRICSAFLDEFGDRYPQFNLALKRRVTDE